MTAWRKFFKADKTEREIISLHLLLTRFRHLIKSYGKILDLITDAAEKQSGHFVFDKQYIISLVETLFEHGESIVFDLNVMTKQRYVGFFEFLSRLKAETNEMLISDKAEKTQNGETTKKSRIECFSVVKKEELAEEMAKFPLLYKQKGQIVCRGVGAGPVYNMKTDEGNPFPEGGVLVASEIIPDEKVIRMIKKSSAILTDYGKVAGHMASIAREFHIPTIVGLKDVTEKLSHGETVTVDADEGLVYIGKIDKLLSYYASEGLSVEEEEEYKLLRKVRRFLFPLTLSAQQSSAGVLNNRSTFHDLIHLSHEFAGETLAAFVIGGRRIKKWFTELNPLPPNKIMVLEIVKNTPKHQSFNIKDINSVPLTLFLNGVEKILLEKSGHGGKLFPETVYATTKEEQVNIIIKNSSAFDMIDALISDNKMSNYIYCRFSESGDEKRSASACVIADKVLSRWDFAVARTAKAVTAWYGGKTKSETSETLKSVGKLTAYLYSLPGEMLEAGRVNEAVEKFCSGHI